MLNQSEMHGYQLNAHLETNIPIALKKPTAYNILEKMEIDGWISHVEEFTGERARKVYSLTPKGKTVFIEMLEREVSTFQLGEYPGLVSLGFLDFIPKKKRTKLLTKRRGYLEKLVNGFADSEHPTEDRTAAHSGSTSLIFSYVRRSLELQLKFLNEVIAAEEVK
jgi:DNA-binding PadR family transcriptional regulator